MSEAIVTDKTLTIEDAPADAKATGDAINNLRGVVGSPLVAATAASMTDTNKVYVYTGSETGYTNGNWYYHDGTSWVSGGVYNSVAVDLDSTLTLANKAPDSKVVGDAISSLNEDITNIENSLTSPLPGTNLFDGDFDQTGYIDTNGQDAPSSNYKRTSKFYGLDTDKSNLYFIATASSATLVVMFYDAQKSYTHRAICDGLITKQCQLQSGDAYFRIYTDAAYSGNICLSYTEESEYVPYEAPHLGIKDESITFSMLAPDAKAELKGWLHGKKIVFMGDSIIGNFYDETGICARLAVETGAEVINCAFGGTQIALRNTTGTQLTYWNKLSGCKLCDAIASGDFSEQEEAVANLTGGLAYFPTRLATLEAVDWNSVDILMWEWGVNDFQNELTVIKDTSDLTSLVSYYGGYCHFIETMLTAYPHLRLVAITPMWRFWRQNGEYVDGADEHAMVGQLLPDFAKCAIEVANKYHIPVIDNYFGMDANKWTRDQYFDSNDSVHPKASGRARIAKRISHALRSIL